MNENSDQKERLSAIIEAWKQSIEVQKHFTEICVKIRQAYITLLSALMALVGLIAARVDNAIFSVFGLEIHAVPIILVLVIIITLFFYFIDRHWYHRLLVGAVEHAKDIENKVHKSLPELGLTKRIGEQSPIDISKKGLENYILRFLSRVCRERGKKISNKKIRSDLKICILYKSIIYLCLLIIICYLLFSIAFGNL